MKKKNFVVTFAAYLKSVMKRIAVFTSGGDAPGMNACIRAVVRGAIYYNLEIYGVYQGYKGLIDDDIHPLHSNSVSNILQRGGTMLKSARCDEFKTIEGRKKAYQNLKKRKIEGVIGIGGDGTFKGLASFFEEFKMPVIGIPGTIDNDIFGTDFTIGYDSAVNTALDAIDKIRDTADSHGRIFFVEVMGRDSGYIALRSAIGGGAEAVILPEKNTNTRDIINYIREDMRREKTFSIIIVAEKDTPGSSVGMAEVVHETLPDKDIRVTILGHIQRGGAPSGMDRILASTLGLAAVEALMDGHNDKMVGIVNNEQVFTTLKESISKIKPLNRDLLRLVKILSI